MAYRADLKKRGATKPRIAHQELFKGLLQRQNEISRDRGIGNAVTGMKFQSVVLGQGRSDTSQHIKFVNHDLDSYKKVLLMLSERPEELSD